MEIENTFVVISIWLFSEKLKLKNQFEHLLTHFSDEKGKNKSELNVLVYKKSFWYEYSYKYVNIDIVFLKVNFNSLLPSRYQWVPIFTTVIGKKTTFRGVVIGSSVDSSALSILPPQVQLPSTPSMPISFIVKFVHYLSLQCEKRTKINKKRPSFAHFKDNPYVASFNLHMLQSSHTLVRKMESFWPFLGCLDYHNVCIKYDLDFVFS